MSKRPTIEDLEWLRATYENDSKLVQDDRSISRNEDIEFAQQRKRAREIIVACKAMVEEGQGLSEEMIHEGDPRHPCPICAGRGGGMHMFPCDPVPLSEATANIARQRSFWIASSMPMPPDFPNPEVWELAKSAVASRITTDPSFEFTLPEECRKALTDAGLAKGMIDAALAEKVE